LSIKNPDTDLFRIKKSTKSISLTDQLPKSQLHQTKLPLNPTDKTSDEILVGLKKNAALKYIEKVEKFKKYKDNKINKQPLFGLNVMQAEYHDLKSQNELKLKDKEKHYKPKKTTFFAET
jgi:hypothetical protein